MLITGLGNIQPTIAARRAAVTVESSTLGIERRLVRSNTQDVLRIWALQSFSKE